MKNLTCSIQPNEGTIDRAIRITAGILLVGIGIGALQGLLQIVTIIVGATLMGSGIVGYCFLYKVLNITTVETQIKSSEKIKKKKK